VYKIPINFDLDSTDYNVKLAFTVHHNGKKIYECNHINEKKHISLFLEDDSNTHEITWTMSGKQGSDTKLNEAGEIIKDAVLLTSNFKLDNFELGSKLINNSYYTHDYNGTTEQVKENYDNFMGCNGTVSFIFTSPAHIWILQNW